MFAASELPSANIAYADLGLDFGAIVWMGATSNRELARQLGVSETAVRRAEKAGRIKREPDGSWDPARVKAAWSDSTDPAQQRPPRSGRRTGNHRALKPVPEAALGAVRETLREHGEPVSAGRHDVHAGPDGERGPEGSGAPASSATDEGRAGRPGEGRGAGVSARPGRARCLG